MAVLERRLFELKIVDLNETLVRPAAEVHVRCHPGSLDALLGAECVADALRRRCLGPQPEMTGRVALHVPDGRVAGYCVSIPRAGVETRNRILTPRVAAAHFLRRVWLSPALWRLAAGLVVRRLGIGPARGGPAGSTGAGAADSSPPDLGDRASTELVVQLDVDPAFRFSNVGFDLMLDMERQAFHRGARRVFGWVARHNHAAIRLYEYIHWRRRVPDFERDGFLFISKELPADDAPAAR